MPRERYRFSPLPLPAIGDPGTIPEVRAELCAHERLVAIPATDVPARARRAQAIADLDLVGAFVADRGLAGSYRPCPRTRALDLALAYSEWDPVWRRPRVGPPDLVPFVDALSPAAAAFVDADLLARSAGDLHGVGGWGWFFGLVLLDPDRIGGLTIRDDD